MPKTYTVIGVYDSDGTVYADDFQACDAHGAIVQAGSKATASGCGVDLQILGAIEGSHSITCACEDSGRSAAAIDTGGDEV